MINIERNVKQLLGAAMTEKEFNELWSQLQKRKTKLIITQDSIDRIKSFLTKTELFEKEQAMIYYESVFDKFESGSIKEFLRTCKKVGLSFKYGGE